MTTFQISTGLISINDACVGSGYAGHPPHVNDPAATAMHGIGPLPVGVYAICEPEDRPQSAGVFVLPLVPDPGNEMFGRSAFYIHGDNPLGNQTASDGCIVTGRGTREAIWSDPDHMLTVEP